MHTQSDSTLHAIIAVFFDIEDGGEADNEFITALFNAMDNRNQPDAPEVPIRQFLGSIDMSKFWSYDGSFTSPPCAEGVKWSIIKEVQTLSPAQLQRFTSYLAEDSSFANGNGNNRSVQPLKDRTLY